MEFTSNERGVHLHTFEDHDAEALQERGRWSRTLSDSDRGRIRSKHRTTMPPRSTHVQPGDVSRALIQQGERERLGKTPSSSSTTAWWWWRSVALQQGFAKHCERRGGRGVGLRQERETLVFGSPQTPTIYRRRGGGCTPSRVPTPRGAAALDGMEGAAKRGREGGAP